MVVPLILHNIQDYNLYYNKHRHQLHNNNLTLLRLLLILDMILAAPIPVLVQILPEAITEGD
jgi:hypothetical protein